MARDNEESRPPGKRLIFRRFRTDPRTNKVLDAHTYGLKAWPIYVDVEK